MRNLQSTEEVIIQNALHCFEADPMQFISGFLDFIHFSSRKLVISGFIPIERFGGVEHESQFLDFLLPINPRLDLNSLHGLAAGGGRVPEPPTSDRIAAG